MGENFREVRLEINLGGEQVEFVSLSAHEAISEPYEIELRITAPLGELDLAPYLGEAVGVTVLENDDTVRYFNGFLTEGSYLSENADGFYYVLTLHSFLYFLESRTGFAIFQGKTVLEVLAEIFAAAGTSNYELRTSETYKSMEYCVQYGESDFNFISRLMEQEGLYYFFEHTEDKHVLIICDKTSNQRKSTTAKLAFNPTSESSQAYQSSSEWDENHYVHSWKEHVSTGGQKRVSLRDFDFKKKPPKPVEGSAAEGSEHEQDKQEFHAYPGVFLEKNRANRLSTVRLEQFRARRRVYSGQVNAKGVTVGTTFKLLQHPNKRLNDEYMITSTYHELRSQSYISGSRSQDDDQIGIETIPVKTQFRAPQLAKKPLVKGLESAIVTGPSGETIYTDEYGRIKVRFHWDRAKSADEKSTCWIRVSQTGGLGNITLPRVGHEVLVSFLHGDPDRPIVTGRMFNAEHMPVYSLPANKTRAVWRTLTYGNQTDYPDTKKIDTGEPKANELRFEDKGGKEEILLHAERDMNIRARFDYSLHIGHNEEQKVGYNRQRYVHNDEKVTIDGNKTYELKKNEKNTITDGNRTTILESGNDELTLDSGNLSIQTGMGKITLEAAQSITLKVGTTEFKLTPTQASLSSTMIKIDGKAMTEVSAGGILTEKGGLIKIN